MRNSKELFLFHKAGYRLIEVDEWLSGDPPQLYSIARHWFEMFRECGDDVNEIIHDGCPTACVRNAAFGYVNVFKAHVNIGFYTGAFLEDPASMLEGSGKRMRHVKLLPGVDMDSEALGELIKNAYSHVKAILVQQDRNKEIEGFHEEH